MGHYSFLRVNQVCIPVTNDSAIHRRIAVSVPLCKWRTQRGDGSKCPSCFYFLLDLFLLERGSLCGSCTVYILPAVLFPPLYISPSSWARVVMGGIDILRLQRQKGETDRPLFKKQADAVEMQNRRHFPSSGFQSYSSRSYVSQFRYENQHENSAIVSFLVGEPIRDVTPTGARSLCNILANSRWNEGGDE